MRTRGVPGQPTSSPMSVSCSSGDGVDRAHPGREPAVEPRDEAGGCPDAPAHPFRPVEPNQLRRRPESTDPGGPGRQPAGPWAELIGQEDPLLAVTREPEQQVEKRTWRAQAARVQGTSKTLRPQRDEDGLPTAKHKQETANFFKMKNNKLPEVRSVQE